MTGRTSRVLLFWALLLGSAAGQGHDSRPTYVEIRETAAERFEVQWKAPASVPATNLPSVAMPASCRQIGTPLAGHTGAAHTLHARYHCPGGLSGRELGLAYPGGNPSLSTLFQVELADGQQHSRILPPDASRWVVPAETTFWQVGRQYTLLGIEHILVGLDHLFFVACLILIARTPKRIVTTVTGFTLAHSLTLALATFELVGLPVATVEAVIALSIVFLCHEIAVGDERSWTWRFPVAMSSLFGLLHGLGFAAVLGEIGLPQTQRPAALAFFNVGVEIGQLLFVAVVVAAVVSIARVVETSREALLAHARVRLISSYTLGIAASFWLLQRVAAI